MINKTDNLQFSPGFQLHYNAINIYLSACGKAICDKL